MFHDHLAYILGERDEQKINSVLLIGVFEASQAQPHEVAGGMPETFSPMFHNIGEIKFSNVRWVKGFFSFAYCVTIASVCFQVIEFCQGTPGGIRQEIVNQILVETKFLLVDPSATQLLTDRSLNSARDFLLDRERVQSGVYRFSGAD